MALVTIVALVSLCASTAGASEVEANPLTKVLELMGSLSAKIAEEGEAAAKAYKEFADWCEDTAAHKKFEIKTATSKQEKLEALIAEKSADVSAADSKIKDLVAAISAAEADLKEATAVRKAEAADFAASETELLDVIDTLGRALMILEREMAKNPSALAQVDTSSLQGLLSSLGSLADAAALPGVDKKKLLALVEERQGGDLSDAELGAELGAPAAAVYKSQSGTIVDILEDLKEKAETELSDLRKAESNAKHNFALLKQSLSDEADADEKDLADEKSAKAAAGEAKATAEGDLVTTKKDLADAQSALELTSDNCMQSAADHEATVKARDEELKIIAEAKKILEESTGGATEQAYSMVQTGTRTRAGEATAEVATLVRKLAKKQHSAALSELASRISAVVRMGSRSPFGKVKALISNLISKLEAEASSEASEKAYCDEEMGKTADKKGELEDDVSKLSAKIDQASSQSITLKAEVKELQAELASLAKQQAEMDKIRQDEHAAFVTAKADLEAGLEGVRSALRVLREYYGVSLLQEPAAPEQHSKASGAGTSLIGILEVVESDFAKSLAAEETQEDGAQAEYDKTTQANKVTKTLKSQDVKYKTAEFESLDKNVADLSGDRDTTDSQLSAVLEYYSKLKERCIAKPETYAERQARRTAEVNGLKEALTVLEDETAFTQRGQRGLRGQQALSTDQ